MAPMRSRAPVAPGVASFVSVSTIGSHRFRNGSPRKGTTILDGWNSRMDLRLESIGRSLLPFACRRAYRTSRFHSGPGAPMELTSLLKALLLPLALGSTPPESQEHSNSVVSEVTGVRFAGTIRGRVVEAGSGAPIAGATVSVNGTRLGAMS